VAEVVFTVLGGLDIFPLVDLLAGNWVVVEVGKAVYFEVAAAAAGETDLLVG
jgi:hypothetical protein